MILDTNALSDWAKSDESLLAVLPADHLIVLPAVALGEYLFGVRRSRERATLESWLNQTVRAVKVGVIAATTAEFYATVRMMLRDKGRPIPPNDMWIAALALQHRLPILSRDTHFDFVDGLTRIAW